MEINPAGVKVPILKNLVPASGGYYRPRRSVGEGSKNLKLLSSPSPALLPYFWHRLLLNRKSHRRDSPMGRSLQRLDFNVDVRLPTPLPTVFAGPPKRCASHQPSNISRPSRTVAEHTGSVVGFWTDSGQRTPSQAWLTKCEPWATAPPARSAAATKVVSANSCSVAPASRAPFLCTSMQ